MYLRNGEKLILMMLTEIYQHLGIKGEIDPEFVRETIFEGHTWGLEWKYPGIFEQKEVNYDIVKEVVNILEMWSTIEYSYSELSQGDKELIKTNAAPFGEHVRFRGFDGNNECDYMSTASFLINNLDRFQEFKDRNLNSHSLSLDVYRRMYPVYNQIKNSSCLTALQIVDVLKEMTHPDNR
jgi:uncharacterized protein YfbU (UPF0304 family)